MILDTGQAASSSLVIGAAKDRNWLTFSLFPNEIPAYAFNALSSFGFKAIRNN